MMAVKQGWEQQSILIVAVLVGLAHSTQAQADLSQPVCDRSDQGDIIGFGVRLGIYFQVGALWVALFWQHLSARRALQHEETEEECEATPETKTVKVPGDVQRVLANCLWLNVYTGLALVIAFFIQLAQHRISDFVGIVALTMMFLQYVAMIIAGVAAGKIQEVHIPRLATFFVALFLSTILGIVWWSRAAKSLHDPECGPTYVWVFKRLDAYDAWWKWQVAMFATALAVGLGLWFYPWRVPKGHANQARISAALVICLLITGVLCVLGIERTVQVNHVDGVYSLTSSAQLTALLLGVFSLLDAVFCPSMFPSRVFNIWEINKTLFGGHGTREEIRACWACWRQCLGCKTDAVAAAEGGESVDGGSVKGMGVGMGAAAGVGMGTGKGMHRDAEAGEGAVGTADTEEYVNPFEMGGYDDAEAGKYAEPVVLPVPPVSPGAKGL